MRCNMSMAKLKMTEKHNVSAKLVNTLIFVVIAGINHFTSKIGESNEIELVKNM